MTTYFYPPGKAWRSLPQQAVRVLAAIIATPTVHVNWEHESRHFDRSHRAAADRPFGATGAGAGEDFSARWANARAQVDSWEQVWSAVSALDHAGVVARQALYPRKVRPNAYGLRVARLKQYRAPEFQLRPLPITPATLADTMTAADYLALLPADHPNGLPR